MTNEEKIKKIEKWQACDHIHPLTCMHSEHGPLVPIEKGDEVILFCTKCGYRQTTIPDVIFEISDDYLTQDVKSYLEGKFGK